MKFPERLNALIDGDGYGCYPEKGGPRQLRATRRTRHSSSLGTEGRKGNMRLEGRGGQREVGASLEAFIYPGLNGGEVQIVVKMTETLLVNQLCAKGTKTNDPEPTMGARGSGWITMSQFSEQEHCACLRDIQCVSSLAPKL